ncbi:MAG: SUMF1/EgtB/PvdO family nonheme iron enzyme [Planctomycetota bacterium]
MTAGTTGIGSAGSTGNFANFGQVARWNLLLGNLTTVGTNGGASYYGAFDMAGNVKEWNDLTGAAGVNRGVRGGAYFDAVQSLRSSMRLETNPASLDSGRTGVRLAAVPEPASLGLAATGCLAAAGWTMLSRRRAAR